MAAFQHIVLFRCPELSAEEDEAFSAEVRGFGDLDGVLAANGGRLTRSHEAGYSHGLVMTVADRGAFERYVADERHQRFISWVLPRAEVAVYDLEVPR